MAIFSKKIGQPSRRSPIPQKNTLNAYHKSSRQGDASPFKRKQPPKSYIRWVYGFLDVILVGGLIIVLIYSLLLNPSPKLITNDTTYHSTAAYQKAAAQASQGVANRNKITFNETAIVQKLQSTYPEIANAKYELPFFSHTPVLRISISKPSFQYLSAGKLYVINDQGVIVAKATDLPKAKSLPTITDQGNFQPTVGKQVLSSSSVAFIKTVMMEAARAKVAVSSMELPATSATLNLKAPDKPYYVKFYMNGNAVLESGQFLAARSQFDKTGQQPGEYLDVRVPGKIFYK